MVNINNVYQTVLVITNKDNRGYITPDEFNKIGTQVQLEIFENYFEDLNQQLRVPENDSEFSNRVENIEQTQQEIKTQIEDLSINSHPPIEFTKKLNELHDKIDSIYTLLETLSNRLNELEYQGEVTFGEAYHVGRAKKHVTVSLRRKDKEK